MIYYCSRRYLTVTFARFIVCQTSAQTLPSVSAPINIQLRSKSTVSKMYLLTSRRHYRIRTKLQQLLISTWTNRRVIAMMLVRPSVSVCLSVCLGQACIVIIWYTYRNLWFDSPMLCAPWHQSMSNNVHLLPAIYFHFHLEERWGMGVQIRRGISRMVQHRG